MTEELIAEAVAAVVRSNAKRGGEPLSTVQLAAIEYVARLVIEGFHEKLVNALEG